MVDTIYFYEPAFKCWGNEHEFLERNVEGYKIFALCTPLSLPNPSTKRGSVGKREGGGTHTHWKQDTYWVIKMCKSQVWFSLPNDVRIRVHSLWFWTARPFQLILGVITTYETKLKHVLQATCAQVHYAGIIALHTISTCLVLSFFLLCFCGYFSLGVPHTRVKIESFVSAVYKTIELV